MISLIPTTGLILELVCDIHKALCCQVWSETVTTQYHVASGCSKQVVVSHHIQQNCVHRCKGGRVYNV